MPSHIELSIVKGIGPVPGDSNSAEQPVEVLSLLDAHGFSVTDEGWVPKLAQVKSGAVYADSPLSDGRSPVAAAKGNVVEQIKLTATAATWDARYWLESQLAQLARDAQDFHTSFSQIEPVYLKWHARNAPGPQYALIYSIEIAQNVEAFLAANVNELSITIEREPYWRGIPPGANPKLWTYEAAGNAFTATNADLSSGTDHLVYGTAKNKQEFDTLYTFLSTNYLDIPAANIPGDAPALVCITVTSNTEVTHDVFIAKSTNRAAITDRAGNSLPLYNVLACSAGSLEVGGAFATDAINGIIHNPRSPLSRVLNYTPSDAAERQVTEWVITDAFYPHFNPTILRGRYMVFVRSRQVLGADGDTKLRLVMDSAAGRFFDSGEIKEELRVAATPALHYMGTVTLPPDPHSEVSARGKGLQVESDFSVQLNQRRSTGTSTSTFVDVILLPINEGCVLVKAEVYFGGTPTVSIYDSTGYMTHGRSEAIGSGRYLPAGNNEEYATLSELQGSDITLTPGVNNRLYFLWEDKSTGETNSNPSEQWTINVNIVPRWVGIRDV
jgi:hypothetical protein